MTASNSNFYQVGASLPVDAPSYVQRQADKEFYQKLLASKFCYVLNSRQMGKSSLRVQTMQRLQAAGTVCATVDLTGIGKVTQEQWYGGIVYKLVKSYRLESRFDFDWQKWWQKQREILSPVQCLSLFVEEVLLVKIQKPIVIFVDEIDKVLSQDFSLDDFFALIRFFQNQRVDNPIFERLTFALLGVATPSDLITDKTQTPFNIGEAIELHGFQIDEVEPLIKGLQGRFNYPQGVIKEIINWTGGQPFLTQKLCKFMVEESEKDNPRSVEKVVNKRIIENWESQDNPEHLRTIRDRIFSSEQRAESLLKLYQQIQQKGEITANNSIENSELRLSGLVVQRQGKLRVYNQIYQRVFNQDWVENQLNNLRPYSENIRFWVASGGKDESRLLRGLALENAEEWAKGKDLSFQDNKFLEASRNKKNQEKKAVDEQKENLEREKKNKEALEKSNQVLVEANIKAKQLISGGIIVFFLTLSAAVTSVFITYYQNLEEENKLRNRKFAYPQELTKLAKKFPENSEQQIDDILKKADITEFDDHQLHQVFLHAYISLAHQYLNDTKSAENSIKHSRSFLDLWKKYKPIVGSSDDDNNFLLAKILVLTVEGNLLHRRQKTQEARTAYQEAFRILQENKISLLESNFDILDKNTAFTLYSGFIELYNFENIKGDDKLIDEAKKSLIEYLYHQLENFLSVQNWELANEKTRLIMLFVTNRKKEGWFDDSQIKAFPCPYLERINDLWVKNSEGYF
ncbi:MAG: AAA-like domain-containing protein, partial [Cyanobacteria bacterium J06632_19]